MIIITDQKPQCLYIYALTGVEIIDMHFVYFRFCEPVAMLLIYANALRYTIIGRTLNNKLMTQRYVCTVCKPLSKSLIVYHDCVRVQGILISLEMSCLPYNCMQNIIDFIISGPP